jgi:hypothetical protein
MRRRGLLKMKAMVLLGLAVVVCWPPVMIREGEAVTPPERREHIFRVMNIIMQ